MGAMPRPEPCCETVIEEGYLYVEGPDGRVGVGPIDDVVALVGGPAWTITYSERQKRRHPDLDTADEGLVVDVVDVASAMTPGAEFREALASLPATPVDGGDVSPRLGLFVGRLLENLETGLE